MRKLALAAAVLLLVHPRSWAVIHAVGLDPQDYTSDFMSGKVVVSVIFAESDGAVDPNTETWDDDRKTQVLSKIMSGLDWWTKQNPHSPLSFTYVTETVTTKYEPITRPYWDESLWISEIMGKLGYANASRFTATKNYVNALRAQTGSDWGYVIFVVDSANDVDGKLADGHFAYAYLGGPYLVMTYDNNGYGIANMDVVAAHETGHMFHALDEYAGASGPDDYSTGYFPTINGNHAYSPVANEPNSIMRGGLRWGLDTWARQMIGWRDENQNGCDDIMDPAPSSHLAPGGTGAGAGAIIFDGNASVNVLPRQGNANGFGFTVDTIARVEFRPPAGEWNNAHAADGHFDSAEEAFQATVTPDQSAGAQSISAQSVQIRVLTLYALLAGAGSFDIPADLSNAHAFPNPFKPNSNLNHSDITFTGLTPGAKVQVFSAAGEPVFEKLADPSSTTLQWSAVNDDGKSVASGVYIYFITNPAGQKKKGKIAVIR